MATERAIFAAGCFWGVEGAFRTLPGVQNVTVGYTGGQTADPTYQQVCTGRTGHAEAALVEFDPAVISFADLVRAFWQLHDPTQLNRQGPDIGTQYRSAIFVQDAEQKRVAEAAKDELEKSGRFRRPIVTQILPAAEFYRAEEYHQQYEAKHGGHCSINFS